jgi:hypothetical protein
MRAIYIIPHPPSDKPEGHNTRYNALKEYFPELQLAWTLEQIIKNSWGDGSYKESPWDIAFIETIKWEGVLWDSIVTSFRKTKLIHLSRAQSTPSDIPDIFDGTLTTGPYEGTSGVILGPFVQLGPEVTKDIDVLLVPSWGQNDIWWRRINPKLNIIAASGWAPKQISRANIVIGSGGAGTLYETLWSGSKLVCLPQCEEQLIRATNAKDAGEAIVISTPDKVGESIERVKCLQSLGRREPFMPDLVEKINAIPISKRLVFTGRLGPPDTGKAGQRLPSFERGGKF